MVVPESRLEWTIAQTIHLFSIQIPTSYQTAPATLFTVDGGKHAKRFKPFSVHTIGQVIAKTLKGVIVGQDVKKQAAMMAKKPAVGKGRGKIAGRGGGTLLAALDDEDGKFI